MKADKVFFRKPGNLSSVPGIRIVEGDAHLPTAAICIHTGTVTQAQTLFINKHRRLKDYFNLELREALHGRALASMQEAWSLFSSSVRNKNKNNNNIASNDSTSRLLQQLPELCKALKIRDQEVGLNQAKGEEMITSLPVFHTVYVKILHPLGCFDFDILLRDLSETLCRTASVFVSKFSPEVSI